MKAISRLKTLEPISALTIVVALLMAACSPAAQTPSAAAPTEAPAATEGGQGDIRMFTNAMAVLRPEERAQFGSLVLREMGKPLPSARGIAQDVGFSPSSFVTRSRSVCRRILTSGVSASCPQWQGARSVRGYHTVKKSKAPELIPPTVQKPFIVRLGPRFGDRLLLAALIPKKQDECLVGQAGPVGS